MSETVVVILYRACEPFVTYMVNKMDFLDEVIIDLFAELDECFACTFVSKPASVCSRSSE